MKSKIVEIAADASFRKFYRITLNKKSKILILSKKDKHRNLFIYASINKFLKSHNILTPKLFEHNFKKGRILIEDFGGKSFYKVLIKQKKPNFIQCPENDFSHSLAEIFFLNTLSTE